MSIPAPSFISYLMIVFVILTHAHRHYQSHTHTLYGHFRSTWLLPDSSYSCAEIHICWNVPMLARMDPPIQEPKRRSIVPFAEIIFRRVLEGARTDRSRFSRSGKPWVR